MEAFYILLFASIAAATVFLELGKRGGSSSSGGAATALTRDFLAFRNNYVLVYALMMGKVLFFLCIELLSEGVLGQAVPVSFF